MTWNNVFGQNTTGTTPATVANYVITNSPFQLNWSWDSQENQIATFTNVSTSLVGSSIILPNILNQAVGYSFQIKNTGNQPIIIKSNDLVNLFTLGTGNIVTMIINNNTSQSGGWQYNQLNVTVQTTVNPSNIAGDGLSLDGDNKLFPQQIVVYLDLGDYANNTYTIPEIVPNTTYVVRPEGGNIILPDATNNDIGSQITIKNSSNGSIYVQANVDSNYYIDLNTSLNDGIYGNEQITVFPDESKTIEYTGQVNPPVSPITAFMYYTVQSVNQISSLLNQASIILPSTPNGDVALGSSVILSDVVNFDGITNNATGTYNFSVPYPVSKVYYFVISTNRVGNDIPVIIINFAEGGSGKQVVMGQTTRFLIVFVSDQGNTTIFSAFTGTSGLMPPYTMLGNNTGSNSIPLNLSVSQVQDMLYPSIENINIQDYEINNLTDVVGRYGQIRGYKDSNGYPRQVIQVFNNSNDYGVNGTIGFNLLEDEYVPIYTMEARVNSNFSWCQLLWEKNGLDQIIPVARLQAGASTDIFGGMEIETNPETPFSGYKVTIESRYSGSIYGGLQILRSGSNMSIRLYSTTTGNGGTASEINLQSGIRPFMPVYTAALPLNSNSILVYQDLLDRTSSATTSTQGIVSLATSAEVIALSNNTKAITPAGLGDAFEKSFGGGFSSQGWQKIPGGLIMQWMSFVATDSGTTVVFPLTFPNNVLTIAGMYNNQDPIVGFSYYNLTQGQVTIKFDGNNSSSSYVYILVIGY